ncbi:MAG: response regulator transcription factor [Niabella sp.]|nr:MAG: response regulator transcription factor [Niabella sp.]
MYRTVIIDDEINCIEVLEILIQKYYPELTIVATFSSSVKALEYLKTNQVDLVFLDIQMPFLTGIDLLASITNPMFNVIFTTAYDQYAIAAIKLSALDYLLKPIDEDLLRKAVDKFKKQKINSTMQSQLEQLFQQLNVSTQSVVGGTALSTKVAVGLQDKILFYEPDEIMYCQSQDNYTRLFLMNGEKIMASKTIRYFEDLLTPSGFIRPHQSFLINSKYIQQYSKKDGGYLILSDGFAIPVSRSKKEEILLMFKGEI